MVALYVTSLERSSGKTAICAGLGRYLLDKGIKTGFFKPIVADTKSPAEGVIDSDTAFIKQVFALEEPVSHLCPVINDHDALTDKIKEAYAVVSRGKDVVIVEGMWRHRPGGKPIEASYEIVRALDARVIIVEGYTRELPGAKFINTCRDFGKHLLGVVLNKVPKSQVEIVRGEVSALLAGPGISVLGVLPEDRVLSALTIGELARHIQGEILNSAEKSEELVENFMLGAMTVDSGLEYYGRKANKAAILRSEAPHMQLAAMETSTRCLVLSGNAALLPGVLNRAEEKKIPVILARGNTAAVVTSVEDALAKAGFNQVKKLPRLKDIMEHFDFQAVYSALGLAG